MNTVPAVLLLPHPVVATIALLGGRLQQKDCGLRIGQDVSPLASSYISL